MIDYTSLSNAALDAAFASAWNTGDANGIALSGSEIASRLSTPTGFVVGLFGGDTFPQYATIMSQQNGVTPQAASAQQAVADSAAHVASSIKLWTGSTMLIVGLVAVAYLVFRFKK